MSYASSAIRSKATASDTAAEPFNTRKTESTNGTLLSILKGKIILPSWWSVQIDIVQSMLSGRDGIKTCELIFCFADMNSSRRNYQYSLGQQKRSQKVINRVICERAPASSTRFIHQFLPFFFRQNC